MPPLDADPRVLGQRIAEARKARGKTQEEVAGFLGYSRPTYIAIEKGDRTARPDEIIKLATYFGRKVSELVRPGEPVTDLQPHLRAVADKATGSNYFTCGSVAFGLMVMSYFGRVADRCRRASIPFISRAGTRTPSG
jgi:DNA-binding XRE family transcriptional regulator